MKARCTTTKGHAVIGSSYRFREKIVMGKTSICHKNIDRVNFKLYLSNFLWVAMMRQKRKIIRQRKGWHPLARGGGAKLTLTFDPVIQNQKGFSLIMIHPKLTCEVCK